MHGTTEAEGNGNVVDILKNSNQTLLSLFASWVDASFKFCPFLRELIFCQRYKVEMEVVFVEIWQCSVKVLFCLRIFLHLAKLHDRGRRRILACFPNSGFTIKRKIQRSRVVWISYICFR